MNDERDVRDLLTRVVPEQPDGDRMPALVRRRRARRATVGVAAGVLAATTVLAIPLAVEQFKSEDVAIDPTFDPRVASEVYFSNPCPDRMPTYDDLPRTLPDLTRVTAVRYCTNPEHLQLLYRDPPTTAEIRASATPDALVTGLATFADDIDDLDDADPDRCAVIDTVGGGVSLALELEDGAQVLVTIDMCADVRRLDGTVIDGGDLGDVFWRRLDAQRSAYAYSGGSGVPLSCTSPAVDGPARPQRETIASAISCPGDGSAGERLSAAGIAELDRAWRDASVERDPNLNREDPCLDADEPPDWLLALTDRGDTIRLVDSACGFLAYSTSFDDYVRYQLDTTGADLTD